MSCLCALEIIHIQQIIYRNAQMEIQQEYTISEATNFLGFKSRSTVNSKTKDKGTNALSYNVDENGNKSIPVGELERVFPSRYRAAISKAKSTNNTPKENTLIGQKNTEKSTNNTPLYLLEIETLKQRLQREKEERERERQNFQKHSDRAEEREKDLLGKLDKAQQTISQQTLLISDMRTASQKREEEETEKTTSTRKGFWGWLLG